MDSSRVSLCHPVLMSSELFTTPERWFACTRLLDPHLTCLVDTPFPPTLTTTVFSQCRSGRFEAGPCRQTPEGHHSSISFVASRTSRTAPALRSALLRHTQCDKVNLRLARRSGSADVTGSNCSFIARFGTDSYSSNFYSAFRLSAPCSAATTSSKNTVIWSIMS